MNLKAYGIALACLLGAIGAFLGGKSWLDAHDARLMMQYELKEKDAAIAQRDKENADLRKRIETQPIQQIIKYVPQIVKVPPNVPDPLPIPAPSKLTPDEVAKLPDAPSVLTPEPTFRLLMSQAADDIACQKDLTDTRTQRDAAIKAAKGGSFWSRFKANKDAVIVGAVLGSVLTVTLKH